MPLAVDLAKLLALALMVVDHVGVFFAPDDPWSRALGRGSFPVWAFCLGLLSSSRVPWRFLAWGTPLAVLLRLAGPATAALNVLFPFFLARVLLIPFVRRATAPGPALALPALVLAVLTLPFLAPWVDYGLMALPFAFAGRMAAVGRRGDAAVVLVLTALAHAALQQLIFDFAAGPAVLAVLVQAAAVAGLLTLSAPRGRAAGVPARIAARSLEIFVLHIVLFLVLAALLAS